MKHWNFFGRNHELVQLQQILKKQSGFVCFVEGSKGIGKKTLVKESLKNSGRNSLYMPVPDSDMGDFLQIAKMAIKQQPTKMQANFNIASMTSEVELIRYIFDQVRNGSIFILDHFDNVNKKNFRILGQVFESLLLQEDVDQWSGGIFVLTESEIHFGHSSYTNRILLKPWLISDLNLVWQSLGVHKIADKILLWSLFGGYPVYYHRLFQLRDVIDADWQEWISEKVFFEEGSLLLLDLKINYFDCFRGRYQPILKELSQRESLTFSQLKTKLNWKSGDRIQIGSYLKNLMNSKIVEKTIPYSFDGQALQRLTRYRISDHWLMGWLQINANVESSHFCTTKENFLEMLKPRFAHLIEVGFLRLAEKIIEELVQRGHSHFCKATSLKKVVFPMLADKQSNDSSEVDFDSFALMVENGKSGKRDLYCFSLNEFSDQISIGNKFLVVPALNREIKSRCESLGWRICSIENLLFQLEGLEIANNQFKSLHNETVRI